MLAKKSLNPQWNGNISNQLWGASAPTANTFTYTYDKLNRLLSGSASGMSESITYNEMGNITSLSRDGLAASTYHYQGNNSNQLDYISGPTLTTGSYAYDANGNATTDGRNGTTINYNILNLPKSINNGSITYTYDATGRKLRKTSSSGTTDYIDGIQYTNGTIDFIQTEEGRAFNNGGSYQYQYNLKDHLGNVRYSFDIYNGAVRKIQQDNYYAFGKRAAGNYPGSPDNKYLYNGKELQDELGQYDYGARFYDPVIGRFTTVDPLAEQGKRWSPYNYGLNNPLRFIDPDGMAPNDWVRNKEGNIYWDKDANSQATTKQGETYLGKDLEFTFNSYINDTFDGPNPPWGVEGDKLTSTINLTSHEDDDGNLLSVDVKSSYTVGETGGLSIFKGRDYFSGLGKDQNMNIDITNTSGFNATFEQHASVPAIEAAGLALLGYSAVNVAQELTLGLSGNNLSVSAATDIFPSATLSVNDHKLFQYNQPSFKATHGNDLINFGTPTTAPNIIRRPAPNFYNRYNR